jgi:superfamily II DNA or RNA helicase
MADDDEPMTGDDNWDFPWVTEPDPNETGNYVDLVPVTPKAGGMGMIRLRLYQNEAVDCIYEAWREYNAVLAVLATGLGKTVIAAEVIIRWPGIGRILFIAHVRELIKQAKDKIHEHTEDLPDTEMGKWSCFNKTLMDQSKVVVASIQTMRNRKHKYDPSKFDLLIIDECHHAGANTYRGLVQWFLAGNPNGKILGITATPDRADGISLGSVFDHCAFEMGIREGIDEGYLVPIKQRYFVVDGLDFSACRSAKDKDTGEMDFKKGDLASAMLGGEETEDMGEEEKQRLLEQQERMLHRVAAPTVREAAGRPGIVYCVTIEHAIRMAEVLRRYPGITAEVVHSKTPEDERDDLLDRFKKGNLQFLVNVSVATEGFDAPSAEVIVMARPTKSRAFYTQTIGRGTRPVAGLVDAYDTAVERQEAIANSRKACCEVFDFVGNTGKHKLVSTADILAGDMPAPFVEAAKDEMAETGEARDIRQAAWEKKEQHDELVRQRQEEQRLAEEERKKELEAQRQARHEARLREEAARARIRAEADYRIKDIDPFNVNEVAAKRKQPEFRGGATDPQIGFLKKLGVSEETSMKWTKNQAGAVIGDLAARTGGKFIMRFGKHIGKALSTLPVEYLKWAGKNIHDADFQKNLEQYRQEWREAHPKKGQ